MSIVAIQEAEDGLKLYGGAHEFWYYKGQECILSGPFECVAGETRIYNPADNSNHAIKWYHENGIAPVVQTLSGKAQATIPFVKGFDALYRVTLDNGMSFVATKGHRVLTNLGWLSVSQLLSERLLIFGAYHPQSSLELAPLEFRQDAQHLSQTIRDYQADYSACHHPCDAQPHEVKDSAPNVLPSQGDAHGHNCDGLRKDAHVSLSEYNHLYRHYARPSIFHSAQEFLHLSQTYMECPAYQDIPLREYDLYQRLEQSRSKCCHCQASAQVNHDCVHTPSSSFDAPFILSTVFNCTIISVEFERYDFYYDLHVPIYEHYLAEGVYHHNTGKTVAGLHKLHGLLTKYANSQAFLTRKTYKSLLSTAITSFEKKVLPYPSNDYRSVIKKYGGEKPEFYDYPNGSRLLIVGMDSDNADKILSGEFDFGYVNQAEEISLAVWETLIGRCTGRAGNAPYTQVMGDCNPSVPAHWILHRASLKLFEQRHEHNPNLYNQDTKEWTEQGKKSIAILSSLTGIRKKRGFLGIWASNEGVVYEGFDRDIHVIARDKVPEIVSWYLSIDFGYTNPFVCQLWGLDRDGRMYLWNEIYFTKRTINAHVPKIKEMIAGRKITAIIADHDAEDRATLAEHGLSTTAAKKDISVGIMAVEDRLKVLADGKPRLYLIEGACKDYDTALYREYPGDTFPCSTEHEFPAYEWPEGKDGKPLKEVPLDLNNHGMDALRYMVMFLDNTPKPMAAANVPNLYKRQITNRPR